MIISKEELEKQNNKRLVYSRSKQSIIEILSKDNINQIDIRTNFLNNPDIQKIQNQYFQTFDKYLTLDELQPNIDQYINNLYNTATNNKYSIQNIVEFKDQFKNKTIAIVGNNTIQEDLSQQIDSCDLVIRLNHFYTYDSGLLGKRIDIIFQTFTNYWMKLDNKQKHLDLIQQYNPKIYIVKYLNQYHKHYSDILNHMPIYVPTLFDNQKDDLTTGIQVVKTLSEVLDCKIKTFAFSQGKELDDYLQTNGKGYLKHRENECLVRTQLKI